MKQSELDEELKKKKLRELQIRQSYCVRLDKHKELKTVCKHLIVDAFEGTCYCNAQENKAIWSNSNSMHPNDAFYHCLKNCHDCECYEDIPERQPSSIDVDLVEGDTIANRILQEVDKELPDIFRAKLDVRFDTISEEEIADLYHSKMKDDADDFSFESESEKLIWDKLETPEYKLMHQLNKILYVLRSIGLKQADKLSYLTPSDVNVDLESKVREVLKGL